MHLPLPCMDATRVIKMLIFLSFTVTTSAIVLAGQGQLLLLQALTVGNLVWLVSYLVCFQLVADILLRMTNFGAFFLIALYSWTQPREDDAKSSVPQVQLLIAFHSLSSMILTILTW